MAGSEFGLFFIRKALRALKVAWYVPGLEFMQAHIE
jgi:hypothetical protein